MQGGLFYLEVNLRAIEVFVILTVVAEAKDPHSVAVHCSVCIIFLFQDYSGKCDIIGVQ